MSDIDKFIENSPHSMYYGGAIKDIAQLRQSNQEIRGMLDIFEHLDSGKLYKENAQLRTDVTFIAQEGNEYLARAEKAEASLSAAQKRVESGKAKMGAYLRNGHTRLCPKMNDRDAICSCGFDIAAAWLVEEKK